MERNEVAGIVVALCTLVLALCPGAFGKVIYVDDGDASGDGSSWQTAYKYLQDALADANNSEKPVEIRVAQGIYKPDRGTGKRAQDPEATFQLISGVALKGAYAGLGEADPNARDVEQYKTVLSGDLTDDDPDVNDARELLYGRGWNSHTVVTGSGTDSTAVLDGFTITGGRYPMLVARIRPGHSPAPTGYGSGMNNLGGSPTVIRCTFIGNMSHGAGGGMCNEAASHPTIIDCAFIRNCASGRGGGAVANLGDSNPTLTRCIFTENSAWDSGGAVYSRKSGPTLDGCTFSRNSTQSQSGGRGGAVYVEESTCTLTDCMCVENNTSFSGGAICSLDNNKLFLERCTFIGNSAGTGGAISGSGSSSDIVITACTFRRNSVWGSGGAMGVWGLAQVSNCIFSGNTCRAHGGAVDIRGGTFANCLFVGNRAFDGRTLPGEGGAVSHPGSMEALQFTNCTFDENYASYGSAVYTWSWPDLRNCILRGPASLIWSDPYEPWPSVRYSNIERAWPGEGNIDVDPVFAAPGYWVDPYDPNRPGDPNDPNTIWMDGDYHLKSQAGRWDLISESWVKDEVTSPCIDAGDPNSPIGQEPFPNGGRVNIGAYGGTAEASKSYFGEPVCETIIAGDLNGDCRVDWRDFDILSLHWLGDTTAKQH